MLNKTLLLIGTFDSKGEEYAYLKELAINKGLNVITMDFGVMGDPRGIESDIPSSLVAEAGGSTLAQLRETKDRGNAMVVMSQGVKKIIPQLYEEGKIDGILGMGGTGGTSVISVGMKELPVGFPKVLVSTAASGNTSNIVGTKDISLIPSVVDVAGINQISRKIYKEALGSIYGMLTMEQEEQSTQAKTIGISMFGNTTECVEKCRNLLSNEEVLVFHCTGIGGKTMEDLVEDGLIKAVLDITTTEWADEIAGGVFSAGSSRLEAPGKKGIPHLIVPGCIDMVNFGAEESVPNKFKNRKLKVWNPSVTLMRTTPEENMELGKIFAEKANKAQGQVKFLIPTKGFSILDSEGNDFWWPKADKAFIASLRSNLREDIVIEEVDANINDDIFAEKATEMLTSMMEVVK